LVLLDGVDVVFTPSTQDMYPTDHHPIGLLLSQFNQGQMPLMKTTHGWHKGDFSAIILPLLHLAYIADNLMFANWHQATNR
jgi:pantothenate synthetase